MAYIVLFFNILLLVSGQLLWKTGMNKLDTSKGDSWMTLLWSPHIWSGLVLYGIATVLWLYVLKKLPLSLAYPLQSLAYVIALVAAVFIFHESVPFQRWVGVAIILVGVIVLAWK
ncbi:MULTISPECIES: EamA family transporter [Paenibacillus]|jgi:drug/metabolite transporter (DMT)-like permease|uniref:EamA family transporter n=1 Tax=Paenibacillus TaxID=44249 RepID=UPI00111D7A81|nr:MULTISPECIES: EamA family transporter [Paenibacillus]